MDRGDCFFIFKDYLYRSAKFYNENAAVGILKEQTRCFI